MSRWWPERLVVGLAPDRVDLLRLGRWPGRSVVDQTSLACTPVAGDAPWAAALQGLDTSLTSANDTAVTVVLSNHFARYLVLPWQPALTRSGELDTLARLRFEQIHGAVVADWTVQLCDGGYGAPLLACAIDSALITGVRSQLERRGLRLASMQGLLMATFNHHRRVLDQAAAQATAERPAVLALIEPGRLCLVLLAGGRWLSVSTRRIGVDAGPVIEQELAAMQVDPASFDVLLVGDTACPQLDPGCPVRILVGPGTAPAPVVMDPAPGGAAAAESASGPAVATSRRPALAASLAPPGTMSPSSTLAASLAIWGTT